MFGYATNETENYIGTDLSHKLLQELAILRRENNEITYLRPDAKSQVTLEYTMIHLRFNTNLILMKKKCFKIRYR
jgi:S-adenosylmethionine synthetase